MQQMPQGGSKIECPPMSKIERIQRYIERTRIPEKTAYYYDFTVDEYSAFLEKVTDKSNRDALCDALVLAYCFGRAATGPQKSSPGRPLGP